MAENISLRASSSVNKDSKAKTSCLIQFWWSVYNCLLCFYIQKKSFIFDLITNAYQLCILYWNFFEWKHSRKSFKCRNGGSNIF